MLKSFLMMFIALFKFIGLLASPVILLLIILASIMIYYYIKFYHSGMRVKTRTSKYKKPSILNRLFVQFPKRFILDMYNRNPDEFREYGLHIFCGEQGSGKTTSVINKLQEWQLKYPKVKVRTNMDYKYEDGTITHWQNLVENDNGIYGQVEVLDEIQTWFNSNQSKNFPVEMLTEISQQRKQRKCLVGTAQVFSRIAKPIREQTTFVYLPITLFGCLTLVRVSKPEYWNDEDQKFKKYTNTYFFVHDEKIRNAFDTYKKIKQYKKSGFNTDNVLRTV